MSSGKAWRNTKQEQIKESYWSIIIRIIIIIISDNGNGTCTLIDVAFSGDRNVI